MPAFLLIFMVSDSPRVTFPVCLFVNRTGDIDVFSSFEEGNSEFT
ncbi:hypothetical protein bcgnr5369_04050 [Bacillus cereus]